MWGSVIAPLSGAYRCYCIDNINDATKSVATKRVRGVADYVAWLRETFAALGIENARVAGLSYGGWLAALCAVHAPELVKNARAHAEKLIPNVHARVLPSVGHILTLDAPDVVVAEMLKALA